MNSVIKPQQQPTWRHWSVLTLIGLSVTYSWLWLLTYRPMHPFETETGIEADALPLDIILQAPQPDMAQPPTAEKFPENPASTSAPAVPPPMAAEPMMTVVPSTVAPKSQPPMPVRKIAPPQKARPIFAAALQSDSANQAPEDSAPMNHAPPEPIAADNTVSKPAPIENMPVTEDAVKPSPPVTHESQGLNPVPVSRLTRTPTFVHKELPADPKNVQIPLGGVRVIARITLDETAAVRDVQIDKSGEPPFDVAVISAIHRSRFTPGYIGDHPVATVFNQTYRFQLQ